MAEAAAVASIVGLASFGIRLTQTLYTFGSNVSSAREDANYIARHVDLYANVLDILTERIDDEEPLLSDAAFDLIEELRFQSNDVFNKNRTVTTKSEGEYGGYLILTENEMELYKVKGRPACGRT